MGKRKKTKTKDIMEADGVIIDFDDKVIEYSCNIFDLKTKLENVCNSDTVIGNRLKMYGSVLFKAERLGSEIDKEGEKVVRYKYVLEDEDKQFWKLEKYEAK